MNEFRVYKPKGEKQGAALKLQYRRKPRANKTHPEAMLFLEIAQEKGKDENGNSIFDWDHREGYEGNSVTMKLGIPDVGEILQVLQGFKQQIGSPPNNSLFHKNPNGNTVLKFGSQLNPKGVSAYHAQLSTSKEHSFRISLTVGEGMVLRILLEEFIRLYYGWQ